jgi:hypothetical protein
MTKAIIYQQQIMKQALKKLDEIEQVKRLFGSIDTQFVNSKSIQLQGEYAELMTMLTSHVCESTGFTILPVDVQHNVVSIAEQKYREVVA